jgi:TonB family protein
MIVWLWANVLLTIFALTFVQFNSNAPHRLRFFVCFVAMCCWLVPWGLLSRFLPMRAVSLEFLPRPGALGTAAQSVSSGNVGFTEATISRFAVTADSLLIVATGIGVMLFAISCYRYRQFLRRLSSASTAGNHLRVDLPLAAKDRRWSRHPSIRIQREVPGALTTGVFAPTIWIHEDLLTSPNLKAALIHEYAHARNHDTAFLWTITLIQLVLWWNPLVRYLSYLTRRLLELSCDESCLKHLSGYRDMLSRLILSLATNGNKRDLCAQALSVFGGKNFNVQRIRALERRYVMKRRHYASTGLLLLLSLLGISWATAQVEGISDVTITVYRADLPSVDETAQALAEEGIEIAELQPGITLAEASDAYKKLSIYSAILDLQWDALETEREALAHELDELRNANAPDPADAAEEVPPVTGPDGDLELIVLTGPIYPPRAIAGEIEGYAIVEYTVTARGTTADIDVIESNAILFNRAAIDAVRNYKYRPRIEGGRAVAVSGVRSRIDFEFAY